MLFRSIHTVVEYDFEVEADSPQEAEELGWAYEDFYFTGQVYSINVEEIHYAEEDNE